MSDKKTAEKIKEAQDELEVKKQIFSEKLTPIINEFIEEVGNVNISIHVNPYETEVGDLSFIPQVSVGVN